MKSRNLSLITALVILMTGCSADTEIGSLNNSEADSSASATAEVTSQAFETEEAAVTVLERIYPDNTYKPLDSAYRKAEIAVRGSVVRFTYQTRDNVGGGDTLYE